MEDKIMKPSKGMKGYVSRLKRIDICFILFETLIAAIIFIAGLLIWKNRANIATIIAVCSLLPACKRLVNFIMILKFKGISDGDYKKIAGEKVKGKVKIYEYSDMLFSSDKYFLMFYHASLFSSEMIAFSGMSDEKNAYAAQYLKRGFEIRGLSVHVRIYTEVEKYISARNAASERQSEADEDSVSWINSLLV